MHRMSRRRDGEARLSPEEATVEFALERGRPADRCDTSSSRGTEREQMIRSWREPRLQPSQISPGNWTRSRHLNATFSVTLIAVVMTRR